MRVLVFGITGFTGGNLARELIARGHEVVGSARGKTSNDTGGSVITGDIFELDAVVAQAGTLDAIVSAVPGRGDDGRPLAAAVPKLLAAASGAGARLGIVGGASSLLTREGGPRIIDDGFPPDWRPEAQALIDVLDVLKASDSDAEWFYLSPAEHYGSFAPGVRRGEYRLGEDVAVRDAAGESAIGGEDYAIAFVDELESPRHSRRRFTVGY